MNETERALNHANDTVVRLEAELAEMSAVLADLLAFLKVAQWRYGAKAASKYAEGWQACAVAALDWIDKHQEKGPADG
jgi:hypothetical protein